MRTTTHHITIQFVQANSSHQIAEVGGTAEQKSRGTVTRYFFSTVIGTVGIFSKMYYFRCRRHFLAQLSRYPVFLYGME